MIRCSGVQSWTSVGRLQPHVAELEDWSSDMVLVRGGSAGQES